MDPEERLAAALSALGSGAKVVRREGRKKTSPVKAFVPRKRNHAMSRSEYAQCGKKTRYASESDARKYAARLSAIRGYPIRVYGPCRYCEGYHLTHVPRRGLEEGGK